jgi:hypothetical protein
VERRWSNLHMAQRRQRRFRRTHRGKNINKVMAWWMERRARSIASFAPIRTCSRTKVILQDNVMLRKAVW